jgi:hypothetical protein
MKYTTQKVEISRGIVEEQEARVVLQRRRVEKAVADRDPAEEARARLLIMEQSLLSMKRFLRFLERDLEAELSLHARQTQKRIKKTGSPEKIENLADDFASRATASVLSPDDEMNQLETLAKAMRPAHRLAGR